jgi:hypothetical protein
MAGRVRKSHFCVPENVYDDDSQAMVFSLVSQVF